MSTQNARRFYGSGSLYVRNGAYYGHFRESGLSSPRARLGLDVREAERALSRSSAGAP